MTTIKSCPADYNCLLSLSFVSSSGLSQATPPLVPYNASSLPATSTSAEPVLTASVRSDGPTEFQDSDVQNVILTPPAPLPFYKGMRAAPSSEVLAALTRPYQVATITWPSTATSGTYLGTVSFPGALTDVPFNKNMLAGFRYLRSGVRLSIRINGNKFLYGSIVASWDPATGLDALSYLETNLFTSTGFPHALISANNNSSTEMCIPYLWNQPFMDLPTITSSGGIAAIGTVDFTVMAPLTSVGSTVAPTVTISVWAEFLDPVVDTPCALYTLSDHTPIVKNVV